MADFLLIILVAEGGISITMIMIGNFRVIKGLT